MSKLNNHDNVTSRRGLLGQAMLATVCGTTGFASYSSAGRNNSPQTEAPENPAMLLEALQIPEAGFNRPTDSQTSLSVVNEKAVTNVAAC
jgi:hypothetical protein